MPCSDCLKYYMAIPLVWMGQLFHNTLGILRVLDITRWRPLPSGLIGLNHPWATGLNPETGQPIWHENLLFRSPRPDNEVLHEDHDVIARIGQFLAGLCAQSAVLPEIPWGPDRPMPHSINYIHGTAHYNSGWLIFNDFADAIQYFSDPRFTAEVRRFVREQQREILVAFRRRDYSTTDYAYFTCCMRTLFPWFCNSNGPRKRVLWGNPAPFPVANIITGWWARDVYALKSPGGSAQVVRPAIPAKRYFRENYCGWRREPLWPEKMLARYTHWRIRLRGAKGGLFFVDRRRLGRVPPSIVDEPIAKL
ncbi:MAG: hypothetical protein EBV06_15800 [Planctomycetia bacterium]|nr:hypothetical protein [Planctomycetia bacterium]